MGEDIEPRPIRNWSSLLYEVWCLAFGMEIQRVLWQLDDFFADVDSPEEPEEGRPRRRAQPAAGGSTAQLAAVPDNSVDYGGCGSSYSSSQPQDDEHGEAKSDGPATGGDDSSDCASVSG